MTKWSQLVAARLGVGTENVHAITVRDDRAVFRVDGDAGPLVAKVSAKPRAFDEEVAAMKTLRAMEIPVSDVKLLESGPPALFAATWTEGDPLTSDAMPETLAEVGRMLRRIHRTCTPAPYSNHPSVVAWIEHWFSIVLPWWTSIDGSATNAKAADAWLESCRSLLEDQSGCLMLFDGRPEHWRVAADGSVRLIDVADLQPGHFAMDLAVLELDTPGILPGILRGYDPSSYEQHVIATLVPLFVLLRALSGADWLGNTSRDVAGQKHYLDLAHRVLERQLMGDG